MNIKAIARRTTWKALARLGAVFAALFGIDLLIVTTAGGSFDQAVGFLPSLIISLLLAVGQMIMLMLANFMLFFGPFLGYAMMGLTVTEPGDTTWDVKVSDVRGQKAAVGEMRKILNLIDKGKQFVMQGGTREKGVLLAGPPGTGKTMLAKAIASELKVPILSTSGASFAGMFMGMDVLKVLMMSFRAKRLAKKWGGSIVFIDELDAIGQRRNQGGGGMMGGMMMGGGQMALNMMLVVMDGLDSAGFFKKFWRKRVNNILNALFIPIQIPPLRPPKHNVFFMAATNRPEVLDEALTRPGRFGRKITFRNPELDDRLDILDLYFGKVQHDQALDDPAKRKEMAAIMDGYSPATIQQTLSMALMYAFERNHDAFNWADVREAMANIEVGMAEPIEFHDEDALSVARHEMGHALALKLFVPDQMPTRLSIRPRGSTLGHLQHVDRREQFVFRKGRFEGLIKVCLASTAAERLFYNENSSGVSGDLEQATRYATQMAGRWGMGDQLDKKPNDDERLGATMLQVPIDGAIKEMLKDDATYRRACVILGRNYRDVQGRMADNQETLDVCAKKLVARKELVGHEIDELFEGEQWNA